MISSADIQKLRKLDKKATKGPWELQDSNSWRRIGTPGHEGDILCPIVAKDGQSDLHVKSVDLELIVAMRNALPEILEWREEVRKKVDWLKNVSCEYVEVGLLRDDEVFFHGGYQRAIKDVLAILGE